MRPKLAGDRIHFQELSDDRDQTPVLGAGGAGTGAKGKARARIGAKGKNRWSIGVGKSMVKCICLMCGP